MIDLLAGFDVRCSLYSSIISPQNLPKWCCTLACRAAMFFRTYLKLKCSFNFMVINQSRKESNYNDEQNYLSKFIKYCHHCLTCFLCCLFTFYIIHFAIVFPPPRSNGHDKAQQNNQNWYKQFHLCILILLNDLFLLMKTMFRFHFFSFSWLVTWKFSTIDFFVWGDNTPMATCLLTVASVFKWSARIISFLIQV